VRKGNYFLPFPLVCTFVLLIEYSKHSLKEIEEALAGTYELQGTAIDEFLDLVREKLRLDRAYKVHICFAGYRTSSYSMHTYTTHCVGDVFIPLMIFILTKFCSHTACLKSRCPRTNFVYIVKL